MIITEKTKKLQVLKEELVQASDSPLYKYRTDNNYLPVIGEGSSNPAIVFVGEAPGKNEALTGNPFCGASGKILDELLTSVNLSRKDVYITNIVKDRPQENRDPSPEEIAYYGPFLERQLKILEPKVIATLGRFSMEYIFSFYGMSEQGNSISKMHGQLLFTQNVTILPLYHPAASIYNRALKEILFDDFKKLTQFI